MVLVVEDDGPLLELAAQIFERAGNRTLCAASAEQALSISAHEPLALVFSDVVLPGRSGLDLADELLAARPDLPVLITTGQWDESVRRAVDRAGHQVLRKPSRRAVGRRRPCACLDRGCQAPGEGAARRGRPRARRHAPDDPVARDPHGRAGDDRTRGALDGDRVRLRPRGARRAPRQDGLAVAGLRRERWMPILMLTGPGRAAAAGRDSSPALRADEPPPGSRRWAGGSPRTPDGPPVGDLTSARRLVRSSARGP